MKNCNMARNTNYANFHFSLILKNKKIVKVCLHYRSFWRIWFAKIKDLLNRSFYIFINCWSIKVKKDNSSKRMTHVCSNFFVTKIMNFFSKDSEKSRCQVDGRQKTVNSHAESFSCNWIEGTNFGFVWIENHSKVKTRKTGFSRQLKATLNNLVNSDDFTS